MGHRKGPTEGSVPHSLRLSFCTSRASVRKEWVGEVAHGSLGSQGLSIASTDKFSRTYHRLSTGLDYGVSIISSLGLFP